MAGRYNYSEQVGGSDLSRIDGKININACVQVSRPMRNINSSAVFFFITPLLLVNAPDRVKCNKKRLIHKLCPWNSILLPWLGAHANQIIWVWFRYE